MGWVPALCLLVFGGVLPIKTSQVYGADFTITCPPSFTDGVQYSVLCQVDRNTISATWTTGKCRYVNIVQFQLLLRNYWYWVDMANATYPTCNTTFIGDARCVTTTGDVATYELRFIANYAAHNGSSLRCWSDCLEIGNSSVTSNYSTCNPVTIKGKPSARHNCPQYVFEGQNLTCTCADGNDTHPGVFRWANNSGSENLSLTNVLRSLNGTQYRCQAVWSGGVVESEDVYTLNVVYGPDSVSATAPDPFDTDGSRAMTLTCSASAVNPFPIFRWTRQNSSSIIRQGQNYTFVPQPSADDGLVFQCQAQNNISNVISAAIVTVRLNYPPTANPVITNNSTDGNLYQGDIVTLTCTVTGGKPVNATSVNLTCAAKQNAEVTVGSTEISSSVTFNPVLNSDHNSTCTCSTRWKQTDWYTRNVQTTLFVNTPPSPPNITVTGGDYPPVARVIVGFNLTCVSHDPGSPAATYTWTGFTGGGQSGLDGQGRGTLTFSTMSREDDGKTVICRASNLYTLNRHWPVADGTFTLHVYYPPVITLSTLQDSACHVTSSTCEVTEGQKVSISCIADSKPAPDNVTWHKDGDTHNQLPVSSDLTILAVNHTIHNGKYNCTVITGNLGKGRLPLTASQQLTVFVKYKPTRSQLTINASENFTLNEADDVDFECLADGRPTPNMELRNDAGIVGRLSGGEVVLEDIDTWLRHSLIAQCQHTGLYRCTARNSVGEGAADTAMLYVNCCPRNITPPTLEVTFQGVLVQLSFHVVAYPAPHTFNFTYLGTEADKGAAHATVVRENMLLVSCRPMDTLYQALCNITVDNVTEADAGYYTVTVANTFGDVDVRFKLLFSETIRPITEAGTCSVTLLAGPIIGGVVPAVVVVAVVVVVVFFLRRKTALSSSPTKAEQEQDNTSQGSGDAGNAGNAGHNSYYTEGAVQPSVSEGLETPASPYAPLQHYVNLRQLNDSQVSEYEELRMRELGLSSPYAVLQDKDKVDTSKDHVYQNSSGTKTHTYANMKLNG